VQHVEIAMTIKSTYHWQHFPRMLTKHGHSFYDVVQLSFIHKVWQVQSHKPWPITEELVKANLLSVEDFHLSR